MVLFSIAPNVLPAWWSGNKIKKTFLLSRIKTDAKQILNLADMLPLHQTAVISSFYYGV